MKTIWPSLRKGGISWRGHDWRRWPFPVWIIVGSKKLMFSTAHEIQIGRLLDVRYCFLKGGLWAKRPWWHRSRWTIYGPKFLRENDA